MFFFRFTRDKFLKQRPRQFNAFLSPLIQTSSVGKTVGNCHTQPHMNGWPKLTQSRRIWLHQKLERKNDKNQAMPRLIRERRIRTRRGMPWTIAEARQLGKTPDSILARRYKRTIREIVEQREARGIALPTGPRRWTAREIKLLGTMNDAELGRRLRRPKHHVANRRRSLKIPPFIRRKPANLWKPFEIKLLGTMRDEELARRLKRPKSAVEVKRITLGIPVFARTFRLYTEAEDDVVRKYSPAEATRRLKRSYKAILVRRRTLGIAQHIVRRNWTKKELALLGTLPDRVLAKRLNRTKACVSTMRQKLGIYRNRNRPGYGPWTAEEDALLGKFNDSEVARQLKRPRRVVARRRHKLGIRAFKIFFKSPPWTKAEHRLLGTMTDERLAKKLGRTLMAIQVRRKKYRVRTFLDRRFTKIST